MSSFIYPFSAMYYSIGAPVKKFQRKESAIFHKNPLCKQTSCSPPPNFAISGVGVSHILAFLWKIAESFCYFHEKWSIFMLLKVLYTFWGHIILIFLKTKSWRKGHKVCTKDLLVCCPLRQLPVIGKI